MGDSSPAHEVGTFSSRADDLALERFFRLYIREIVRLHGVPASIVSDRDPRLAAHFWKSFQKGYGHTVDYEYNVPPSDRWSV